MNFRIILNVSVALRKKIEIALYCLNYSQLSTIHSSCQLRHMRAWVLRVYYFDMTLGHNSSRSLEINISETNSIKKCV